jgi:hypothetical protein
MPWRRPRQPRRRARFQQQRTHMTTRRRPVAARLRLRRCAPSPAEPSLTLTGPSRTVRQPARPPARSTTTNWCVTDHQGAWARHPRPTRRWAVETVRARPCRHTSRTTAARARNRAGSDRRLLARGERESTRRPGFEPRALYCDTIVELICTFIDPTIEAGFSNGRRGARVHLTGALVEARLAGHDTRREVTVVRDPGVGRRDAWRERRFTLGDTGGSHDRRRSHVRGAPPTESGENGQRDEQVHS